MKRIWRWWVAFGLVGLPAAVADATDTQLWISDSPGDYIKAESHGVVVRGDGVLALGPRAVSSPAESLDVIWAIAVLKDGSVAVGGGDGRILRWTESRGLAPWVKLPVGQVLSLAADQDGVLAGTGPDGLIYRIGVRGDTTRVARTGERYVWGLCPAGGGAWYAATGTRGRLLEIEDGHVKIVLDTDESNLVSLVPDGRGGAYAGGDSKGRVLHLRANGSTRTVFDATEDEVRALAIGPDGALYAAALSASAISFESDKETKDEEQPQPARTPPPAGRATVYRIVPDSSVTTLWTAPQPLVFALAGLTAPLSDRAAGLGVVAATGNRAGVFLLSRGNFASQWLAASQGQVTALAVDSKGRLFAGSSNPGALWRIGPDRAERGELLSQAFDARHYARFGRLRWRGSSGGGRVELWTRSGNTETPDTTWSEWALSSGADGGRSISPPARYFQWKIMLAGGDPAVDAVEAAWREQNLPPRIEDLTVAPQGTGFREGELQPRSEPVTQTLPGGQKVEYSLSTSTQKGLRELPTWARGLRTVQWKGTDPNGDALRYKVDVRAEGGGSWIKVGEDLEASAFTWETSGLPDGRYRLRVLATDAPGNPVNEELNAEALSEPFTIDNTPPAVTALDARGERGAAVVSGQAEDEQSMISRIEVSLDDDNWRPVSPESGLADEKLLRFRARLQDLKPGDHIVAVKAVDLAGNSATRSVRITVPGAK